MRMIRFLVLSLGVGVLCAGAQTDRAGTPAVRSLGIAPAGAPPSTNNFAVVSARFPGESTLAVHAPTSSWVDVETMAFDVWWPADGPTNAMTLVYLQDWDHAWFQNLRRTRLRPGEHNRLRFGLRPQDPGWEARGHHGAWYFRALMQPKAVGIRIFSDASWEGSFTITNLCALLRPAEQDPPFIRNVRTNGPRVPVYDKFEITLEAPDRYADPFDAGEVRLTADFVGPDGATNTVDGFYGRSYYRDPSPADAVLTAQDRPYWRVRFAPLAEGRHTYTLRLRDRWGEAAWGPAAFDATAPQSHGFIRVSRADPRCFEFSDGTPFFPIGHNIRSAFDARMNEQFPWARRRPEGTTAYERYFRSMAAHGQNMVEIWSAAWSLGLEWSDMYPGYHGIGQFNLMNAWELDRVIDWASAAGIHINLVIHNHGKFSDYLDAEWADNPFNKANGGYLASCNEYFTDPRAQDSFRKLMRYFIARWGYSRNLFAWQLWSELNLAGSGDWRFRNQHAPHVLEWHRMMGRAIKEMDPNDHLVSTHCSGDYTLQNTNIIALAEMDLCPVDAYHGSTDPCQIVALMRSTAEFNAPYGKPSLITEFGGSHMAQGIRHLDDTLHAALWSSPAVPVGGTPLFWWWQVIDEENFYPKFQALSRFMAGEDRRGPDMQMGRAQIQKSGAATAQPLVQCYSAADRALGWIYYANRFGWRDPAGDPPDAALELQISGMTNSAYSVEFWDTTRGQLLAEKIVKPSDGLLTTAIPPFARDVAFKIHARGVK